MNSKILNLLAGSVIAGTVAPVVMDVAPAQAFILNKTNDTIVIDTASKPGSKTPVDFNNTSGARTLSARTTIELVSLVTNPTLSTAKFSVNLQNLSSTTTNWLLRSFSFRVIPSTASAASVSNVNPAFASISSTNTAGATNFCFSFANNCNGSGQNSTGLTPGQQQLFTFDLNFIPGVTEFTVDTFAVNFQRSSDRVSVAGEVPTPALLPGLVGMGLAALRKRRGEQEVEQEESVNV